MTLQDRFHDLANSHQKVIFSTIVARENLLDENLAHLPESELREIISRSVKILNKVDQYIVTADKNIDEMKSFLYKTVPPSIDIVSQPRQLPLDQ